MKQATYTNPLGDRSQLVDRIGLMLRKSLDASCSEELSPTLEKLLRELRERDAERKRKH